jgi:hypothetical protein
LENDEVRFHTTAYLDQLEESMRVWVSAASESRKRHGVSCTAELERSGGHTESSNYSSICARSLSSASGGF